MINKHYQNCIRKEQKTQKDLMTYGQTEIKHRLTALRPFPLLILLMSRI